MSRKISRRDFARTSVAAGAAVAAATAGVFPDAPAGAVAVSPSVAAGAAAARRHALSLAAAGGDAAGAMPEFRDAIAYAGVQAAQTAPANTGRPLTIPGEYYIDESHFADDERFVGEHLWLMADHVDRIPKPGDYFVFEYGRGESVIVMRNKAGEVKGYHNVCRHRGSRLARHHDHPAPKDTRLSVKQAGPDGNTPVFRCPYHAWTYDIDGKLISVPVGMPGDFDIATHGLRPVHLQITEGVIFVNFAQGEPPNFEEATRGFTTVAREYGVKDLKIAARLSAPTMANWKLVLENFQECYHCGPAHRNLVTTHPFWDGLMPQERRGRLAQELDKYIAAAGQTGGANIMGQPGSGAGGQILNVNFISGSLDGKPVAPLLPAKKEWTHRHRGAGSGWSTGALLCYDDHVVAVRFTPRTVKLTDAELFWLVSPTAKAKDLDMKRLKELWEITYLEDKWLAENNHLGIESIGGYRESPYAQVETGPRRFVNWYMTEVVPAGRRQTTTA